eukprot:scaffold29442_cov107-Isochrysis_galbana.AAC.2
MRATRRLGSGAPCSFTLNCSCSGSSSESSSERVLGAAPRLIESGRPAAPNREEEHRHTE